MCDDRELKELLKRIPSVQKMFLSAMARSSERNENSEELFATVPFRETLASNLFLLLSSKLEYDPENRIESENLDFLSNFIWTIIEMVPTCILVSVVLANIEFKYGVDLSDFHRDFGRELFVPEDVEEEQTFRQVANTGKIWS